MFKQSCTNLSKLPKERVLQWLSCIETIISDIDGVLWHMNAPIEGAIDTFNQLKSSGRGTYLATNNTVFTSDEFVKNFKQHGLELCPESVLTVGGSVARYLQAKKFQKTVFVVGEAGLHEELRKVSICSTGVADGIGKMPTMEFARQLQLDPDVGAVLVGKDDTFTVHSLIQAGTYLMNKSIAFLGVGMDGAYPIGNNRILVGSGPIVAAMKALSRRKPLILGKPNPWVIQTVMEGGSINPEKTLMIGDTLRTDILFAHNCKFQSMLVGTGANSLKDAEKLLHCDKKELLSLVPDTYLPSLAHLKEFLC